MHNILIVEDEKPIADLLKMALTNNGYLCKCVYDGLEASDIIEEQNFDLLLLDIMLPEINGFEVMEYAKSIGIPVIFLSAMDNVKSKVKGLKMGAEDYITKPFEILELIARVENVLKRHACSCNEYFLDDITIDTTKKCVMKSNEMIDLSSLEFELFLYFVVHSNQVLTREQIYRSVWGSEFNPKSRTVDMSIRRLKNKLGYSEELKSIYNRGYILIKKVTDEKIS